MNKLKKYRFSDLYEMSSGISTTKEQAGHGSPFLSFGTVFKNYYIPDTLNDLMDTNSEEQSTFSVKKGDIFVTRTSETPNELAMSCVSLKDYPNATFSGFLKRLRPKKEKITYDKFMAFYLRSNYFRKVITNNTIMTLRASFNEDMFSFLDLYLPNYDLQVKIGDFLFDIEEKIRTNNKINDNLEHQIQTIYNYWFTQFEFPDDNCKPYKSTKGIMVYNNKLKKDIPFGWNVQSIASNVLTSIIKPGVDTFEQKVYLATADVKGTTISSGTLIDYENRESRANMQPTRNSVWFAKMKNSIKHLYFNKEMSSLYKHTILSTGFCGLQCDEISFEYISSYISNEYFELHKDILAHGATQEAVNNDDLENISILIPSENIINKYHDITQPLYAQISKNICENQHLTKLRDWLLPMLMNGQATIED